MKRFLATVLFLAFAANLSSVYADGWTQRKGHGYYKLSFRYVSATSFYEPNGTQIDIPTLRDYTVSFYGEYGLTDRLSLFGYVPFFERITLNEQVGRESGFVFFEGDDITNVADPDIGVRYGLIQGGSTVLSASLRFGVPLGQDEQPNGLLTGDGELNQWAALEVGHSFWPIPAYAIATAGFNNRVNGFSDEFIYSLEGGYTFGSAVTVIGRLRGVESLKNGDDRIRGGSNGLYANNQRYLAIGAEMIYTSPQSYGISFTLDGAAFGENVLAAPAFTLGVFLIH